MASPFLTAAELRSVVTDYQMDQLETDDALIDQAILAAVAEATSYLNGAYDCGAIFSAKGTARNVLVLEHCKTIALWYLIRKANADIYFDRVKEYYKTSIEWFRSVAGVGTSGRKLAPDLPIKQADGVPQSSFRTGSNRKFSHNFD